MPHSPHDPLQTPRWQWWLVIISGALTLICGTVGVAKFEQEHLGHVRLLSALYHAAQMLILHTPHFEGNLNYWIEAGRWFGVVTLFGVTLTLLCTRFRREIGLLQVRTWSDHYVICGLGRKGFELARCLKGPERNARVVVVDPHPDPDLLTKCAQEGICVLTADASNPEVLAQVNVRAAKEVVVLTPSDETNVRIALEVAASRPDSPERKSPCHVHLSDIHLRDALQQSTETEGKPHGGRKIDFFDVFDDEARRILLDLPLDGDGIAKGDPRSVHVAILGFGRMGRSLALRAAKIGHFANGKPLRISVVDRNAEAQRQRFLFRHPVLAKNVICTLDFHQAEAESLTTRQLVEQWAASSETLLHVFVCLSEDARTLEVALRLRTILQKRQGTNLLVRIHTHESLARLLGKTSSESARLIPFGMVEDFCSEDAFRREYNEALSRAIHEQFVLGRMAGSQRRPENDPALRPWENVREDIRESNRQQADHIAIKLRAVGCVLAEKSAPGDAVTQFSPTEIGLLAQLEHSRWNAERWLAGWRYGTPSDKNNRVSENLAHWDDLHHSIQNYDWQAVEKISEMLTHAKPALKIVRKKPV
ncbi:MAG: NAD-binding protein [Verrucomicrobiia bacterium]